VDAALAEHPGVREAIAFAVPHPRLGQDVAAAVVRASGSDVGIAEIRNFIRGRLAPHKTPRRVEFVSELPVGPTGKPQRRLLTELLAHDYEEQGPTHRPFAGTGSSTVEAELFRVWCAVLNVDHLEADEDFLAAGGDSILATKLVASVSATFDIDLPVDVVFRDGNTIAAMAKILSEGKVVPEDRLGSR
jgi:acyl carrier protein